MKDREGNMCYVLDLDGELTTRILINRIVAHYREYGKLPKGILLDQEGYTQLMCLTGQDFVLGQHAKFRGLDVYLLLDQ